MHKLYTGSFSSLLKKTVLSTAVLLTALIYFPMACFAGTVYTNPETGYEVIIDDAANLLTDSDEQLLADEMKPVTEWGNAAFLSIDNNHTTTERYIENYYGDMFGSSSGTVFMIDMDNRNIYVFSDGRIYRTITKAYANTITDNIYTHASDGDYYTCASEAFSQIYTLLDGGRIAQPMKYISNALIALIAAFIINFIIIKCSVRRKKADNKELIGKIFSGCNIGNSWVQMTHQTRVYSPQSSGGGSSGGGGGGGGGGSSGGGGGHSF